MSLKQIKLPTENKVISNIGALNRRFLSLHFLQLFLVFLYITNLPAMVTCGVFDHGTARVFGGCLTAAACKGDGERKMSVGLCTSRVSLVAA